MKTVLWTLERRTVWWRMYATKVGEDQSGRKPNVGEDEGRVCGRRGE